jgi:hypothetical protein
MRLVCSDKAIGVSKTEPIALCWYDTVPVATDWEARKPAREAKANAPEGYDDEKADANPSHVPSLENAQVLEEKSDLDHSAVGDVDC